MDEKEQAVRKHPLWTVHGDLVFYPDHYIVCRVNSFDTRGDESRINRNLCGQAPAIANAATDLLCGLSRYFRGRKAPKYLQHAIEELQRVVDEIGAPPVPKEPVKVYCRRAKKYPGGWR